MKSIQKLIVTGASKGIGKEIATTFLESKRHVTLVARDEKSLQKLAQKYPKHAHVLAYDLNETNGLERLAATAAKEMNGLDGLINCAGIFESQSVDQLSIESLERNYRINFLSPLLLAKACAHQMKKQKTPGSIINIASTLGIKTAPQTLSYSAMKAALLSATQTLALELAKHQIRVNSIAPGCIDTDMLRQPRKGATAKEIQKETHALLAALTALHPLGRLGEPKDIAAVCLFLIDQEWITGSTFTADGGLLLHTPA